MIIGKFSTLFEIYYEWILMSRVHRAITAFFFFFFFPFFPSINVIFFSFFSSFFFFENVCLSNPPFPLLFPKSWGCVCGVGGGRAGGCASARRVCEWVSVCVCCTHQFSFFTLAFVLVNDLSLVSRCFLFWKCVRFCFRFCCRLFLFVVCTCILCLLPCHTRCSFIDVLSLGFLK